MSDIARRVGIRIRELRREAGLSQSALAERVGSGVAFETISRFERGAAVPSFRWLERISEALGISIDEFLAGLVKSPKSTDGPLLVHEPASDERSKAIDRIVRRLERLPEKRVRQVERLLTTVLDMLDE